MHSNRGPILFVLALFCFSLILTPSEAIAAYVPVIGGPEYNSAAGNSYLPAALPSQPVLRNLVNNSGTTFGNFYKATQRPDVDRRIVQWSSSLAPPVELQHPARFAGIRTDSWAYAINDSGTVVGATYNNGYGERPMRWDASGAPTELAILGTRDGHFTWGQAYAINNAGITVGYSDRWHVNGSSNVDRAARWDVSGAITELGDLSPGSIVVPRSRAHAVNESGTTVGYAQVLFQGVQDLGTRAVRWDGSGTAATELGNLGLASGRTRSEAYDVNESGAAVGWANKGGGIPGIPRAVRWDATTTAATELENLGGTGPSWAYSINDVGTAVGVDGAGAGPRAVRWEASGAAATALGHLGTDATSHAYDINNSGFAVGDAAKFVAGVSVGLRAVAWRDNAVAIDLNDLIDPQSGWILTTAQSISETGWITGLGSFDPDGPGSLAAYNRQFLLQLPQVPEPVAKSIAVVASLCSLGVRPSRRTR
jgi:uncharacterized membrane protein